jgi:hypothetical protein
MNASKILKEYSSDLIKAGKALEKHPILASASSGAFSFGTSGAIIGGIVGGIDEDETFLGGAAKGALIGAGIGAIGGVGVAKTMSTVYMDSGKISDFAKLMQGLGHDGLGFEATTNGYTGKYIV